METVEEILLKAERQSPTRCSVCGSTSQKVCGDCFNTAVEELNEGIRMLKLEVDKLKRRART